MEEGKGCERVRLEEGKGVREMEGGLRKGRGCTTKIELKIGSIVENCTDDISHFLY